MKIPKQVKTYCPHCKKHTTHKVAQLKIKARPAAKKHALGLGSRKMARVFAGYGGFPRPVIREKFKTSRKATFILTCDTCKKAHTKRHLVRTKKVEITNV